MIHRVQKYYLPHVKTTPSDCISMSLKLLFLNISFCMSVRVSVSLYVCRWVCPLPSTRQHPSYGDCLEVKREYYQNSSVLDCDTKCHSPQHTYMSSSYRSNRLGLSHWDAYAVHRGGCLILATNWFPSVL